MFPDVSIRLGGLALPLLMVLAAACAWSVYRYAVFLRAVDFPRRWLPLVLRAAALALVVVAAAQPRFFYPGRMPSPREIAVLIDASQSMYIEEGRGSGSRFRRAVAAAEILYRRRGDARVRFFTFAGSPPVETTPAKLRGGFPGGAGSAVLDALDAFRGRRGGTVTEVVLLSDGADTGVPPAHAAGLPVPRVSVPVVAIGFGDPGPAENLTVDRLYADEIVEAGASLRVGGSLSASGLKEETDAVVELRMDGAMRASRRIKLGRGDSGARFSFTAPPGGVGVHAVSVSARLERRERVTEDNARTAYVNVVGGRQRVLYADAPRWEFKFLKRFLEGRDGLEADFIIFSPKGNLMNGPGAGAIASPSELARYRVVVLGAVGRYMSAAADAALAGYVSSGGALVMLGGSGSVISPRFRKLAALMPVAPAQGGVVRGAFGIRLTSLGARHAVTRLGGGTLNEKTWSELPYLYTYNPAAPLNSSNVLAAHPWNRCGGSPCPIIAEGRGGKGTVVVLAAEGFWRWALHTDHAERYETFWRNVMTHALESERERDWSFTVSRRNVVIGERVCFTAQPASTGGPGGRAAVVGVKRVGGKGGFEVGLSVSGRGGAYAGCFRAEAPGDYSAELIVDKKVSAEPQPFSVEVAPREFLKPYRNDALLKHVADSAGGAGYDEGRAGEAFDALLGKKRFVAVRKEWTPLRSPAFYVLIVALLCAEWGIRRREGLV
ncbi:MAG: hypothetical protein AB1742_03685 [bacterium]